MNLFKIRPVAAGACLFLASQAHAVASAPGAADNLFGCTSGAWTDASCWSTGAAPREYQWTTTSYYPGDNIWVVTADATNRQLLFTALFTGSNERQVIVSDLRVGGGFVDGIASLVQSSGDLVSQGNVRVDGRYLLQSGQLSVLGATGRGDYAADASGVLVVGRSPSRTAASFDLQGGSVTARRAYVGYQGSTAVFSQSGGDATFNQQLSIGNNEFLPNYQTTIRGAGRYTMSGGTLTAPVIQVVGSENVGYSAFEQSGGTVKANVSIGLGTWTMTGGSLQGSVSLSGFAPWNPSYFYQRGGTVAGDGAGLGTNGHYEMTANAQRLTTTGTSVSGAGSSFLQAAGIHTTGSLSIGSQGSYTLTGGSLVVTGKLTNAGTFKITGGDFWVGGAVVNSGTWDVQSASMTYAGTTEFTAGSTSFLGTGALATYQGEVKLRTGALLTGGGTRVFAGGLSVGNSPGSVTASGNAVFTGSNTYTAEIGGLVAGTGYDFFKVSGSLSFGGKLVVTSWNDYSLQVGQTFDLFDWGSASGHFSSIDLSGLKLADGAVLDTSHLYLDGTVAVVPEPATHALWLAGIGMLGLWARRRSHKPA